MDDEIWTHIRRHPETVKRVLLLEVCDEQAKLAQLEKEGDAVNFIERVAGEASLCRTLSGFSLKKVVVFKCKKTQKFITEGTVFRIPFVDHEAQRDGSAT